MILFDTNLSKYLIISRIGPKINVIFIDFPKKLCDHMPHKSGYIGHNRSQNLLVLKITEFTDVPVGCYSSFSKFKSATENCLFWVTHLIIFSCFHLCLFSFWKVLLFILIKIVSKSSFAEGNNRDERCGHGQRISCQHQLKEVITKRGTTPEHGAFISTQ